MKYLLMNTLNMDISKYNFLCYVDILFCILISKHANYILSLRSTLHLVNYVHEIWVSSCPEGCFKNLYLFISQYLDTTVNKNCIVYPNQSAIKKYIL